MDKTALKTALCAALDTGLNHVLAIDATSSARSKILQSKVIRLDLADLPALWFCFSPGHVDILAAYEVAPDAALRITWQGLALLREPEKLSQLIRENQVDLQGDPALIQAFNHLFSDLHIDWEERLSTHTGDVLAYWICQGAQRAGQQAWRHMQSAHQLLKQSLTADGGIATSPLELAAFCDDVTDLASSTDALLKRADALLSRS
jgi:ubiquinone biosynthesis protein UbiJ